MGRFLVFILGTVFYAFFVYLTMDYIDHSPSLYFIRDFALKNKGWFLFILGFIYLIEMKGFFNIYNEFVESKEERIRNQQRAEEEARKRADEEAKRRAEEESEARRQKELNFELAKKRQELELELEHYKQMALINASIDEGKLQYLEKMRRQAKEADLEEMQKMQKMLKDLE